MQKFKNYIYKRINQFFRFFWKKYDADVTPLSEVEYKELLITADHEQKKAAYEKAWDSKNFEIENYWKRATYFWTFLVPAFAGYFALINSDNYKKVDPLHHIETFLIICVGLVISVAWALVNQGSKSWQRNWEAHVDLLEDSITGPLYKIVFPIKTYSVSKINELVSWFFVITWIMLSYKYMLDQNLGLIFIAKGEFSLIVSACCIAVLLILMSMLRGYGRGYFSNRSVTMHKRNTTYKGPTTP
jgi:hypothetical protein